MRLKLRFNIRKVFSRYDIRIAPTFFELPPKCGEQAEIVQYTGKARPAESRLSFLLNVLVFVNIAGETYCKYKSGFVINNQVKLIERRRQRKRG